eukprot:4434618-Prymnesium_polylepis.1
MGWATRALWRLVTCSATTRQSLTSTSRTTESASRAPSRSPKVRPRPRDARQTMVQLWQGTFRLPGIKANQNLLSLELGFNPMGIQQGMVSDITGVQVRRPRPCPCTDAAHTSS